MAVASELNAPSVSVHDFYRGRKVVVTGGFGFIGSTLARLLVHLGAEVTVVDALVPQSGGNRFNLAHAEDFLTIRSVNIRRKAIMRRVLRDCDVVFNLAGLTSHVWSMRTPLYDLSFNCDAQLRFLEVARLADRKPRIVFTSTRQVYGVPAGRSTLDVDEDTPLNPVDVNGAHKAAGEYYHQVYSACYGLPVTILRFTNVYGPRQGIHSPSLGFVGWFVRCVIEGRVIEVFGDGLQERDFLYVDDAALALVAAGANATCANKVYNVGSRDRCSVKRMVEILTEVAGGGTAAFVPWPPDRQAIDVGSITLNWSRFLHATGWQPQTALREGLAQTVQYYRAHLLQYTRRQRG